MSGMTNSVNPREVHDKCKRCTFKLLYAKSYVSETVTVVSTLVLI